MHKIQGQTIERTKKTTVDLKSVFEGAQAYVMLSRLKELDQLYVLDEIPKDKIYPIKKAQEVGVGWVSCKGRYFIDN